MRQEWHSFQRFLHSTAHQATTRLDPAADDRQSSRLRVSTRHPRSREYDGRPESAPASCRRRSECQQAQRDVVGLQAVNHFRLDAKLFLWDIHDWYYGDVGEAALLDVTVLQQSLDQSAYGGIQVARRIPQDDTNRSVEGQPGLQ